MRRSASIFVVDGNLRSDPGAEEAAKMGGGGLL